MQGSTLDEQVDQAGRPSLRVSRSSLIDNGMLTLQAWGADHICKVCIANSGSCCRDCQHLSDGVGCQLRNTSCTAWLCGFHKYLLYEVGQLENWQAFWRQVPGQDYREDSTPDQIIIDKALHKPGQMMDHLGEALAADLLDMAHSHTEIGLILTLREKLDRYIDQFQLEEHDQKRKTRIKRKIKVLSGDFQRFHYLLNKYYQELTDVTAQ
ncbi:hypothetical protein [Paenibacillus sp. LHD-38]|uniref:hypothetical protein n=1 Tax=Paenibacillus sp. LHD-38 TaxID=3072143 RepID=UPI00280E3866|nr:hypothetical protein [Paenibacillus sp. LHD-38]MDQ8738745.1 hypothetical protein [Paenibacillus sp. LHD-38]